MKILNPATGALLREVEEDTTDTIRAKAQRARRAQPAWAARPLAERIDAIARFRALVKRDVERLAAILTSEVGKPIAQSRNELNGVDGRIAYFLENVEEVLKPQGVFADASVEERITLEPLGVVANISAWNYPWFVGSNVFIPALLTGNAVLYKPSEFATLTGLAIAALMKDAGVPDDVFVPVIGGGAAGAALLDQPIAGVFFTGSYRTGVKIAEVAARRLLKVQLELGGKDPIYVCDDVDVRAAAAATADGAFYNNGQSCCSVERIYVHERVFDSFVQAFVETVKGFKLGDPIDDSVYIGPLTRAPQLDVVEAQIKDAVAKGARLATGGRRVDRPGHYFEPTVLVGATHEMEVMREESFGPVIGIQKVKGDDEALERMNDTAYGLTAGVYTRDRARAVKLLAGVRAGSAYWNCCDRVSPRLPWSGRGHSGVGSTLSTLGIQTFVQPKAWHLKP